MKNILMFCLLVVIAGNAYALGDIYAGLGLELNAVSSKKNAIAGGGNVSAGLELNEQFDVGLKTVFSHDFNELGSLGFQGLLRYKPPLNVFGFFVQAEIGTVILFYDDDSYPSFLGGAAAGMRIFPGGGTWYLEPTVRAGYPFIWGIGLTAGTPFSVFKGGKQ